jgi:hypothetical protein
VAEPLHDLKQGMEDLKNNKTFKFILAAMLQIGNFLNGANVRPPFQSFHSQNQVEF